MEHNSVERNAFIAHATQLIEANLSNEKFGVTELARELNISRSNLYFKIKSITGRSASQFIREIRLKKGKAILEAGGKTISEVAYEVGFASPAYFSHCFHEHYGFTPGDLKRNSSLEEQDSEFVNSEKPETVFKYRIFNRQIAFVFIILLVVAGGWMIAHDMINRSVKPDLSIIVLPFKNLSEDETNRYFADGITEDILNNLYWITSLRVVSRTSSDRLKNTNLSTREIAKEVGARYILEGSVRRFDDDVRISIQLIDAKKDDHLWSDNFDRNMKDIIHVQNEIALKVANKLKAVIPESEITKIEKLSTQNSKAYDYYLQARFLLHRANSPQRSGFDAAGVINSVQYYQKAIEADSAFAEAYAGLANATMMLTAWGIARDTGMVRKTYQLCQKALELDPDCAEAHTILALNYWFRHDFVRSGEEHRKSIKLNPNFATARQWYAQYLMITGPISEARKQEDKALELEPYFWVVKSLDSWIAYFEKDYERSLEVSEVARDLNPNFPMNAWLQFLNYVKLKDAEKAHQQIREIARIYSNSDNYSEEIDRAFDENGIEGLLNRMIDINNNHPIPVEGLNGSPFYTAWWYAILGDHEEALSWLEETLSSPHIPYHYMNLILFHPDFEFLHDDPRFVEVTRAIGIADYWPAVKG